MSDGHARCPTDGCKDVEPYKDALVGPRGLEPPRTPYLADRREGGCGTFWFETSSAAAHNDRNRGLQPKHLKGDGVKSFSLPSDEFRAQYERIFGHD